MKISASQSSAAHTSAGRRPGTAHAAQRSTQYPAQRSAPAPVQEAAGTVGADGYIPDLATGAETLAESLEILVQMAAGVLCRTTGERIDCGLVLHRIKRGYATAGTGIQAARLARLEQEVREGPLSEALAGGGTVAMNHAATDFRWARFRPYLRDAGFNSVLALRLRLDEGAEAALVFFAAEDQAFPLQVIAEARSFADAASRGLRLVLEMDAARTRASDLKSALESRTSIDIACGVIMAQNRCSYNEAIAIIAKASSHRNIKLRKVAEGILENLPGGAPNTHFEH